jgi:hypothetical protein
VEDKLMVQSLQALLADLIDYAGLFPPAALPMPAAVHNYAHYLADPYPWILGRFIVPAVRLEEFEQALAPHLAAGHSRMPWRLSVLCTNPALDSATIRDFNRRYASGVHAAALVDSIEVKVAGVAEIEAAVQGAADSLRIYCEIPIGEEIDSLLQAIGRLGARAKVRCGGVNAETFPATNQLARFLTTCTARRVGFKATAGLHHSVRGSYRITYDADSPEASMHGFLNFFLAAAFSRTGMPLCEIVELLEENSGEAFQFRDDGVDWRGHFISSAAIALARSESAFSFGSCSFAEPVGDLRRMNLI